MISGAPASSVSLLIVFVIGLRTVGTRSGYCLRLNNESILRCRRKPTPNGYRVIDAFGVARAGGGVIRVNLELFLRVGEARNYVVL